MNFLCAACCDPIVLKLGPVARIEFRLPLGRLVTSDLVNQRLLSRDRLTLCIW
jgi:hypothetical protein